MSKTKFRDKGLSPTVAQADNLMAAMPRFRVREDDDHVEVKWREFTFGSMRGQYRTIRTQIDLLSVYNLHPHNGHFRRLLEHVKKQFRIVRILHPHERLCGYLVRNGFEAAGDHVFWRRDRQCPQSSRT